VRRVTLSTHIAQFDALNTEEQMIEFGAAQVPVQLALPVGGWQRRHCGSLKQTESENPEQYSKLVTVITAGRPPPWELLPVILYWYVVATVTELSV
jgi:hypothetical protein